MTKEQSRISTHPLPAQMAFHLGNLWPYREQAFARTLWFADEIAEGDTLRKSRSC
jgi:hypothetical protein